MCELVKTHHEPVPSPIVQRFKFNTRTRAQGETVAAYVAALRELAKHCQYGASLQEMLRDRLVCGVNHEAIQKRLLSEKDLTYKKAYSVAQAIEVAEKDTKHLKSGATGTAQQILYHEKGCKDGKFPPPGTGQKTCYRCGGNHLAPACKHKDIECNFCRKKGHLARVCRSKKHEDETKETKKPPQKELACLRGH